MKKDLNLLIDILTHRGYTKYANEIRTKQNRIKVRVDPLTFAVSQGLLNPQVLSVFDEEGHEEDLEDFKELLQSLKEDDSEQLLED